MLFPCPNSSQIFLQLYSRSQKIYKNENQNKQTRNHKDKKHAQTKHKILQVIKIIKFLSCCPITLRSGACPGVWLICPVTFHWRNWFSLCLWVSAANRFLAGVRPCVWSGHFVWRTIRAQSWAIRTLPLLRGETRDCIWQSQVWDRKVSCSGMKSDETKIHVTVSWCHWVISS